MAGGGDSQCAIRGSQNCGRGGFCCLAIALEGGIDDGPSGEGTSEVAVGGDSANSFDGATDGADADDGAWGIGPDGCTCTNSDYGPCGLANPCGCCPGSGLSCTGSQQCVNLP
jgi:hypothetical protein